MRVMRTSGLLLVVLLALCMLAPAAGAIYIEGQTIPDDGLMHILSTGEDTGAAVPAGMTADESLPVSIPAGALPAGLWDDTYAGDTGVSDGYPSMIIASTMPAMLPYEELASMPAEAIPSTGAIPAGLNAVVNAASPALQDYWNFADLENFQTNMPTLSSVFS
jgi:hypothetical protein